MVAYDKNIYGYIFVKRLGKNIFKVILDCNVWLLFFYLVSSLKGICIFRQINLEVRGISLKITF